MTGAAALALLALSPASAGSPAALPWGGAAPEASAPAIPEGAPVLSGDSTDVPVDSMGEPAARIPLDPLHNRLWKSGASLPMSCGSVRVFGMKSANGSRNWFFGFATPDSEIPVFRNGRKMLRYKALFVPVLSGSASVDLHGRDHTVYLQGDASDRWGSRVTMEEGRKSKEKACLTVRQIAAAAYASGASARLGGREYRAHYVDQILEDGQGEFAGVSDSRAVILMYRCGDRYDGYHFAEPDIPRDRIAVSTRLGAAACDGKTQASLRVGVRVNPARELELYEPGSR